MLTIELTELKPTLGQCTITLRSSTVGLIGSITAKNEEISRIILQNSIIQINQLLRGDYEIQNIIDFNLKEKLNQFEELSVSFPILIIMILMKFFGFS